MGFDGLIIVFEKGSPNVGASMHPNGTLTIPATTWENGFSRFGTQISGEGAVAHKVGHISAKLPEPYLHENIWKVHGTPDQWLGEEAVSHAAAESTCISEATKQQLLQDAAQCERYADLLRRQEAMLERMKAPIPGDDLNALLASYRKWQTEILTPFEQNREVNFFAWSIQRNTARPSIGIHHLAVGNDMTAFIERLNAICSLQPCHGILIAGWFLSEEQIASARGNLTLDMPPTEAIGRLLNVPVYPLENARDINPDELRTHEGVMYSFLPWPV